MAEINVDQQQVLVQNAIGLLINNGCFDLLEELIMGNEKKNGQEAEKVIQGKVDFFAENGCIFPLTFRQLAKIVFLATNCCVSVNPQSEHAVRIAELSFGADSEGRRPTLRITEKGGLCYTTIKRLRRITLEPYGGGMWMLDCCDWWQGARDFKQKFIACLRRVLQDPDPLLKDPSLPSKKRISHEHCRAKENVIVELRGGDGSFFEGRIVDKKKALCIDSHEEGYPPGLEATLPEDYCWGCGPCVVQGGNITFASPHVLI